MYPQEILVPRGPGRPPTLTGATWPTIPANTPVVATFSPALQKLLLLPWASFTGTLYVALDADTVDDQAEDALVVEAASGALLIGADRPHLITKIALRSTAPLVLGGAGRNATLIGWPWKG